MAAENQEAREKAYISSQSNPYGRVDEELPTVAKRDKKRRKCVVYILAFIVIQACVLLILGLTLFKVRSPKFRVRSATFDTFEVATFNTNSSFNIKMIAELGVKNTNFGKYKYKNSTIEFYYQGIYKVGEAYVPRARAKARSTKKFTVTVDLSSSSLPVDVASNIFATGAIIPFTSQSQLRGEVNIMKIVKTNKSSNMNCTMEINISSKQLGNVSCK